jgi:hypothetical protein
MAAKSDLAGSDEDLRSLYNAEAVFEYTSRNSLAQALRAFLKHKEDGTFMLDCTVLVTKYPPKLFNNDEDDNHSLPQKGKPIYFEDRQTLIFTMLGGAHEHISTEIHDLLRDKLLKMNCWHELRPTGSINQSLGNVHKEPDQSWGPAGVGYYHPTCVLEVGMTESLRAVENDAQRWLKSEISPVTQVITIKIYPRRRKIVFAIWRMRTGGQQPESDEMCIEMHGRQLSVTKNRYLRLHFGELFARSPKPRSSERDVLFSAKELADIAQRVWKGMGDLTPAV